MDCDINMDLLITLVESRPVLWDKTTESYKNKLLNFTAWKQICIILKENFEELSDKEKTEFGKHVVKKWSNARDNWMKYAKKLKEYKSGSRAKLVQKYRFYDQMQFLDKIVSYRPRPTNMPPPEDVEESRTTVKDDNAAPKKRKKKEVTENDELDKRIWGLVDSVEKEDNSRIMSFFRGIAPTIEKFNDADLVEFQYQVIKTMRNISQRKDRPYYLPAPYCSSRPKQTSQNINQNPYKECHATASSSSTKYNENEKKQAREYVTFNTKGRSPKNTERSIGSTDSLDTADSQTVDSFDYDFVKSPEFGEVLQ